MMVRNALDTATRVDVVRRALRFRRFPSPGFAALTQLAQAQLGVRTVVVTLLDEAHQHFAAGVGLPQRLMEEGMPADRTFCHRVLQTGRPLVIDDTGAVADRASAPSGRPAVLVRAYAGFPIVTSDGFVLGAFCAAHDTPRSWTDADRALLEQLATATAAELEVRAELAIREDDARAHDPSLVHEGMLTTAPAILESITDAFIALDREWRFTWVNPAARELLGSGSGSLVGRLAWAELPTPLVETLLPHLECAIESGRPYVQDDPVAIGTRFFTLRAYPARHGLSVFLRDVTARLEGEAALRQRDERLRQAQKMEAIGLLTGGVAHDFNNILTVIQANADALVADAEDGGVPGEALLEIQQAAERAAGLTRQLLAFSRKQVLQPRVLDPNASIAALLPMLRRLIAPSVRIETDLGHDLSSIRCDPGQLEQVLLNLAVNARDAMPSGGTLRLRTEMRRIEEGMITPHATISAGQWVTLAVSDTGRGIPAESLGRIFEPFFTTKTTGTGLGLATVYGIVEQSGAAITVESEVGAGTEFTLWFPPVAEPTVHPAARRRRTQPTGRGTVLLVDDEPAVRGVVARILGSLGYTVVAKPDGEAALEALSDPAFHVDLLLSDVAMPGLDGAEVVRVARALRPGLRCLLMSGYAESAQAHEHLARGEVRFIPKPFTLEQLGDAVRGAFDPPVMSA